MKRPVLFIILFAGFLFISGVKPQAAFAETTSLSDPLATDNAKLVYKYLSDQYGKKILTGQMENAWNYECNMLNRVHEDTGKYPAIMGFDFMNYTSLGWKATNKETERAINYWNGKDWSGKQISQNHGIVTFMWHWRDPLAAKGTTGEFYSDKSTFRIPYNTDTGSWNKDSTEYKEMMQDLDVVAKELAKLQAAGVPVLWRPMHEAAGNLGLFPGGSAWFWWGAGNTKGKTLTNAKQCGETYIALWRLMYDYFTKEKQLHNLIWVWNGQNKNFYPGSEYVDIIGDDIYETILPGAKTNQVNKSNKKKFNEYQAMDPAKLTALTECGNLPDIKTDGILWSFFMVWNDGHFANNKVSRETDKNNFWSGEFFNSKDYKIEIYVNDPNAITLDEVELKISK